MEVLGHEIGKPVLHVGQTVLYISDANSVACPAIVTAIYAAPAAAKNLPQEPGNVDLTVFSTNPGATTHLANIAFGTGKGTYNFIK